MMALFHGQYDDGGSNCIPAPRISIEEGQMRPLPCSQRRELYYDVTPVDFGILMGLPPTEVMAAMVGLFLCCNCEMREHRREMSAGAVKICQDPNQRRNT